MDDPKRTQINATRRVLRYLRGIIDYGIWFLDYVKNYDLERICYSDAYWCGDKLILE